MTDPKGGTVDPILAGQLFSVVWKATFIFEHRHEILQALLDTIDIGDIVIIIILGWYAVPLFRLVHRVYFGRDEKYDISEDTDGAGDEDKHLPFASSVAFSAAKLVSQVAKLACLVYLIECLVMVFDIANPEISFRDLRINQKITQIIYTTWGATRLMAFKRYLLSMAANKRAASKLGKLGVYDRILDILILFCLTVSILDICEIDVGPGLASLFAFGGVGTLVISLACKDLVAQLVCGVVVSTSENFYVGDDIQLGDDTCGVVDRIGWFYTDVRGYDERVTRIPNEQLANRRICNVARVKKCQIMQSFKLRLADLDKVSPVCTSILEELKKVCPKLISDGSRPCRATLREVHHGHLLVVVDTHYNIPCIGDEYFNNRDTVLQTICRVLRENDVVLACPKFRIEPGLDLIEVAKSSSKSVEYKRFWWD